MMKLKNFLPFRSMPANETVAKKNPFMRPLISRNALRFLSFSAAMHVLGFLVIDSFSEPANVRLSINDHVNRALSSNTLVYYNPEEKGSSIDTNSQKVEDLFFEKYVPKLRAEFATAFEAEEVQAEILHRLLLRKVEYSQMVFLENSGMTESEASKIVSQQMDEFQVFLKDIQTYVSSAEGFKSQLFRATEVLDSIPYYAGNAGVFAHYFPGEGAVSKGLNCEGRAMLMGLISTMSFGDKADYAMHLSIQNRYNENYEIVSSTPHISHAVRLKGQVDLYDIDTTIPKSFTPGEHGIIYGRDWLDALTQKVENKTVARDGTFREPITNSVGSFSAETYDGNIFTVKDDFAGLSNNQKLYAAMKITEKLLAQGYRRVNFTNFSIDLNPVVTLDEYDLLHDHTNVLNYSVKVKFRPGITNREGAKHPVIDDYYGRILWDFSEASDYGTYNPELVEVMQGVNNVLMHKDLLGSRLDLRHRVFLTDWHDFNQSDLQKIQSFLNENFQMHSFGVNRVDSRISEIDFSKLTGSVLWYESKYFAINANCVDYPIEFYNKFKSEIEAVRDCEVVPYESWVYCVLR